MEDRLELLKKLGGISSTLSPIADMDHLAREIEKSIEQIVNIKWAAIYLLGEDKKIQLCYATGFSEEERAEAEREAEFKHPGWVVRT